MKAKSKLFQNTVMLYVLTFSSYFFNFVTIPYQTRVLGPELFGKIGMALAISTYFKLLFDFGFILSATEEISKNRDNHKRISRIITAVSILKLFLIAIGLVAFFIIVLAVPELSEYRLLYLLYFVYVAIDSLQPDYLYRGIEEMKVITIRNVVIKAIFTVLVFVFLKERSQYLLIPIFYIAGSVVALIAVYYHTFKKLGYKICRVTKKDVKDMFDNSKIFFLSRIASTLYGATNTFILGLIYPSGNTLGYYSSSEKVLQAGRSMMSPISDSVYPYMVKRKDFRMIKKILTMLMPFITIACVIGFILSDKLCIMLFGAEYSGSSAVLRLMIPILWLTLPSYILGFPTMTPLGLKKEANYTVIIGSVFHIIGIGILLLFGALNLYSICALTIITELSVLVFRIIFIVKARRLLNTKSE